MIVSVGSITDENVDTAAVDKSLSIFEDVFELPRICCRLVRFSSALAVDAPETIPWTKLELLIVLPASRRGVFSGELEESAIVSSLIVSLQNCPYTRRAI